MGPDIPYLKLYATSISSSCPSWPYCVDQRCVIRPIVYSKPATSFYRQRWHWLIHKGIMCCVCVACVICKFRESSAFLTQLLMPFQALIYSFGRCYSESSWVSSSGYRCTSSGPMFHKCSMTGRSVNVHSGGPSSALGSCIVEDHARPSQSRIEKQRTRSD